MVGTITFSLEIELAWGVNHLDGIDRTARFSEEREKETEVLRRLLNTCEELDLPFSFNVVGHLLEDECAGTHDGPYPDDWFQYDPGTDVDTDPLFYAPDLVNQIVQTETAHELCTHTFSHVLCNEVNSAVVDHELQKVRVIHSKLGLPRPRSFVPPIHAPPPYDVLRDHGIRAVRVPIVFRPPVGDTDVPANPIHRAAWRFRHLYPIQVLRRTPPVRSPVVTDGIVETYTTWHTPLTAPFLPNGQQTADPVFRVLPLAIRQRLHERYLHRVLELTIEQDSYAHLWSHLFNLSNEAQWPVVRSFLESVATAQEAGEVTVRTMAGITDDMTATVGPEER